MKNTISVVVAGLALLIATMMSSGAGENVLVVKGQSTDLGVNTFTWDNTSFDGFIGAEQLTFSLSNVGAGKDIATLSNQPDANNNRGVVYWTAAQLKNFKYKPWGKYDVIGFLGDRYFAAYDPTVTADVIGAGAKVACLYDATKHRNLMTNEQISKILIDNNTETLIASDSPLKLEEGYELHLKSVNVKGTQAIVDLMKNGQSIDTKMIRPLIAGATMPDKTYCYKADLGVDTDAIVQIAVHFKSVSHGASKDSAVVDGIFQISDMVMPLKYEQQYDKMSVRNVDATGMTITMDNKDNQITLSKNIDVPLMQNIHIKTADQSIIDAPNPLRYYIYSEKQ